MCRIILGGTGGQGIITLGKLLATAGMNEGRNISCYPLYGAEMRGGYAFATVIISETEIPSPIVSEAEVVLREAREMEDRPRTRAGVPFG